MCRSSGAERSRKLRSLRGCVRMTARDTLAAMPGRCRAPVCKSPRNFALCCKMLGKRHPTCSWAILSVAITFEQTRPNFAIPGCTRLHSIDTSPSPASRITVGLPLPVQLIFSRYPPISTRRPASGERRASARDSIELTDRRRRKGLPESRAQRLSGTHSAVGESRLRAFLSQVHEMMPLRTA